VDGTLQHVHHPELTGRSIQPRHDKVVLEDHQLGRLPVGPASDGRLQCIMSYWILENRKVGRVLSALQVREDYNVK